MHCQKTTICMSLEESVGVRLCESIYGSELLGATDTRVYDTRGVKKSVEKEKKPRLYRGDNVVLAGWDRP